MRISGVITIFYLVLCFSAGAQLFRPPITNYSPKDYGKSRTPENFAVTQDNRGIIYVASGNGLLEFDGATWRFISVKNGAYVRSLATGSDGTIYVGAQGDFGKLSTNTNGKLEFSSFLELVPDSIQFTNVWQTLATDDHIYFQAENYIFDFDIIKKTCEAVEPINRFHTAFVVEEDLITRESEIGLYRFQDAERTFLELSDTFANTGVFGLFRHNQGYLVLARDFGLYYIEPGVKVESRNSYDSLELVQAAMIGSHQLSNGLIAVNTIESGVLIINTKGEIIHRLNKRTGIRVNDVKAVYEDRENNLWLALNNGISKVNYNSPLSYYSQETNLEGSAQAVVRHNNDLYVGTSSGMFIMNHDPHADKEFTQIDGINGQVWDFHKVGEKLIACTSEGIFEVNGSYVKLLNDLPTNRIIRVQTTDEYLLVGARGIYSMISFNEEPFPILEGTISGVTDMVRNASNKYAEEEIWIGTTQQGVIRIQINNFEYSLEIYGELDGLISGQWVTPFEIGDSVLFGSINNVYDFMYGPELLESMDDPEGFDVPKGMFVPTDFPGIPNGAAVSHMLDDKSRIWACIDDQILYIDKSDYSPVNRPFWGINFGRTNRFYLESSSTLWIGAADGLIRFKENESKNYALPFFSVIRSISISEDSTIYYGGHAAQTLGGETHEFDYKYNSIRFTVAAPYFEDDHEVLFSYKLEGQDEKWSAWSKTPQAVFTTLREGTYTFKVKAMNVYGQESEIASYTFTILPPWYRSTWAYVLYAFAIIILIILAIRISSIRLKRKNERLEQIVAERTQEIAEQNEILHHQKEEIMDSITYAQRIQEAILPLEDEISSGFTDSMVLFMPKDIVSGDFYWYASIGDEKVVVCADCTGHGVPGAFMSMIGSDKLNHFVKEKKITDPAAILSEMNKGIKFSLKQTDDEDSTKDGMDAAICTINTKTNTLRYAGANRSLWMVRDGELNEIKATKTAVAGHTSDDQIYELNEIEVQKGDCLYMSSDGYADQFGGPKGKKFKVKAMKELILNNVNAPMHEQLKILQNHIEEWMGDHEQIDDICIVAIRI